MRDVCVSLCFAVSVLCCCYALFMTMSRQRLKRLEEAAESANTTLSGVGVVASVSSYDESLVFQKQGGDAASSTSITLRPPVNSRRTQQEVEALAARSMMTVAALDSKCISMSALTTLRKANPELPSERQLRLQERN